MDFVQCCRVDWRWSTHSWLPPMLLRQKKKVRGRPWQGISCYEFKRRGRNCPNLFWVPKQLHMGQSSGQADSIHYRWSKHRSQICVHLHYWSNWVLDWVVKAHLYYLGSLCSPVFQHSSSHHDCKRQLCQLFLGPSSSSFQRKWSRFQPEMVPCNWECHHRVNVLQHVCAHYWGYCFTFDFRIIQTDW